jgi:hypothetical protein
LDSQPRVAYIARTVATFDPHKERQRLKQLYGAMVDGELEEIAADGGSLSDIAREVLQSELTGRHSDIRLPDPCRPAGTRTSRATWTGDIAQV